MNRGAGQLDSFSESWGFPSSHKTSGSVKENHIGPRAGRAGKYFSNDICIALGISPKNFFYLYALNAKVLRCYIISQNLTVPYFRDFTLAGNGDLIQAIGAMNDKGSPRTQLAQDAGHHFGQVFVINTQHLGRRLSRVAKGSKEIEHRPYSHFSSSQHDVAHSTVEQGRIKETYSYLVDALCDRLRREVDRDSERLHDIRAAAKAGHAAVAVLGYRDSATRDYERGSRGDVEGSCSVTPGAAGIDKHFPIGSRESGRNVRPRTHPRSLGANHSGKADQFLDSLPFHPKGSEQGGYLSIGSLPAHKPIHHRFSFRPIQMLTVNDLSNRFHDLHGKNYMSSRISKQPIKIQAQKMLPPGAPLTIMTLADWGYSHRRTRNSIIRFCTYPPRATKVKDTMNARYRFPILRSAESSASVKNLCSSEGFSLVETMIAMVILTFGLLAAGQLMYVAMASNSLSRSKGTAMTVGQDKLEFLSDLYRRDPANADLTNGDHGPEQVAVTNPNDSSIVNRFNVAWNVSTVPDPRAGKVLQARLVRVTVTPIQNTGTTANSKIGLNKVVNVTAIFSPKLS